MVGPSNGMVGFKLGPTWRGKMGSKPHFGGFRGYPIQSVLFQIPKYRTSEISLIGTRDMWLPNLFYGSGSEQHPALQGVSKLAKYYSDMLVLAHFLSNY
jgi:hypothetical protein